MKQKVLFIIYITMFLILILANNSFADPTDLDEAAASPFTSIIGGADSFIDSGGSKETQDKTGIDENTLQTNLQDISNSLYKILLVVGIVIAVIFASILGIQFMFGSIEDQAKVKEALIPFVIGCLVVFGAFTIWKIVVTIGNQM